MEAALRGSAGELDEGPTGIPTNARAIAAVGVDARFGAWLAVSVLPIVMP